jgi:SepF-like predicted cell division protein (DUF552 family)
MDPYVKAWLLSKAKDDLRNAEAQTAAQELLAAEMRKWEGEDDEVERILARMKRARGHMRKVVKALEP